jgi:hypothetical protein
VCSSDLVSLFDVHPSGTHKTIFDGTIPQYNVVGGLNDVDITNTMGLVSFSGTAHGRLNLAAGALLKGGYTLVDGLVTTQPGSRLEPDDLHVNADSLNLAAGTFGPPITEFRGGHVLPVLPYQVLWIRLPPGDVMQLESDFAWPGSISVFGGNLDLNGHYLAVDSVLVELGYLTMQAPSDSIEVNYFTVYSGDQSPHLRAGVIHVRERLIDHGGLGASGTHRIVLGRSGLPFLAPIFEDYRLQASHLHDVEIIASDVPMAYPLMASGALIVRPGVKPHIHGASVQVADLNLVGTTFDTTAVTVTGAQVTQFDSVSLLNRASLKFISPGAVNPVVLNHLFLSSPYAVKCLIAVDSDGQLPQLSLDISSDKPIQGTSCTDSTSGPGPVQAHVNWH